MKVVYSDECLSHDPPYEVSRGKVQAYVESPARLKSIKQFIDSQPDDFSVIPPQDYSLAPILDVHDDDFIEFLSTIYNEWVAAGLPPAAAIGETFAHKSMLSKIDPAIYKKTAHLMPSARVGLYTMDMSVSYTKDTWRAAYVSAQLALTAAHTLLKSQSSSIYALCRPPGHHASCNMAAGYCFINNVAVVARFLQNYTVEEMDAMAKPLNTQHINSIQTLNGDRKKKNGSLTPKKKVMIVDIDYHHGNGTQDIFYDDPSVLYISLHGHPDYPFFTGSAEEKGRGEGEGYNINIPLNPATTDDALYLDNLTRVLESATAVNFGADIVIVSMGLDTWCQDPIAGMKGLKDVETYTKMGRLFKTAPSCEGRPILFVQEGGYTVDMLGKLAGRVLQGYLH